MSARKTARSKAEIPTGDQTVFPPPPAIPKRPETDEDRAQQAEISRLLRELGAMARQNNLDRAVRLAQMAARGQGPLVDFFAKLGLEYYKLADEGPPKPALRTIEGRRV